MITSDPFLSYHLLLGVIGAIALVYLAYLQRSAVAFRFNVIIIFLGIALFVVVDPITILLFPQLEHLVHAIAAIFIIIGLYDPVSNDLRTETWSKLLLHDPWAFHETASWMRPMDDEILHLFNTTNLILTPTVVSININRSREEVNRRLRKLAEEELVERVDRGKYTITPIGEAYLRGESIRDRIDVETDK